MTNDQLDPPQSPLIRGVIRSALFVPGHRDDLIDKTARSGADCLFLDLEDGVPEGWKAAAREGARKTLESGTLSDRPVFVRINSLSTNLAGDDIEATACAALSGFLLPQTDRADQVRGLESRLEILEVRLGLPLEHFALMALIESPRGVLNAAEIATASKRLAALVFGCEDFLAALQGRHGEGEAALLTPRAMIAMAARAAGIEAIDTPYVRVHDLKGLKRFAKMGRDLGMSGMCALSPRQLPIIHEIYTPTEEEIRQAEEVVQAAQQSQMEGHGVMISGGAFVSPPTVRAAKKLLERAKAIKAFEDLRP